MWKKTKHTFEKEVIMIKFLTLDAICKALDCQPGDLLEYRPDTDESEAYGRER